MSAKDLLVDISQLDFDRPVATVEDIRRVNPQRHEVPLPPGNGGNAGTVLVDGEFRATWTIARDGGRATLTVRPVSSDACR